MAETIFLLNNTGELVEMSESHYLTENDFQKLLAEYPSLISGDQINKDDPRRWLLVSREMAVPDISAGSGRWSLDHLFIDQDGIPTLVEVKRSSDTRLRREVIGQILDYAANAVTYWSIEEIVLRFQETCESDGKKSDEVLDKFLDQTEHRDKFWDIVNTNLSVGKIRLLLVADKIPKEMQRIIEFLNEQMTPCEILGVKIKQFIGQDLKTLVPRVIGATIKAQNQKSVKSTPGSQWNEERFFEEIKLKFPNHIEAFKTIYQRSLSVTDNIWWGEGARTGSFVPNKRIKGIFYGLFAVCTAGSVEIQFQHIKSKPPFNNIEIRKQLLQKINEALLLDLTIDVIEKRPNIKIEIFEKPGAMDAFFKVTEWFFDQIKEYYQAEFNA